MNIKLDIPLGSYRELTKDEFSELNTLIANSIKEFKPWMRSDKKNKNE
jgi:hypothetical protein